MGLWEGTGGGAVGWVSPGHPIGNHLRVPSASDILHSVCCDGPRWGKPTRLISMVDCAPRVLVSAKRSGLACARFYWFLCSSACLAPAIGRASSATIRSRIVPAPVLHLAFFLGSSAPDKSVRLFTWSDGFIFVIPVFCGAQHNVQAQFSVRPRSAAQRH